MFLEGVGDEGGVAGFEGVGEVGGEGFGGVEVLGGVEGLSGNHFFVAFEAIIGRAFSPQVLFWFET